MHHKYIGTRFGPILEAIGMSHVLEQVSLQFCSQLDASYKSICDGEINLFFFVHQRDPDDSFLGQGREDTVQRPTKRMGPTGAGVDSNFLHPVISLFDLDDEEQVEDVATIAEIMKADQSHLFKMSDMQQNQGGGGGRGPSAHIILGQSVKAHNILYPIATHHMLEDLDTLWNLWYTHKLPLKWWLEDRSTPCEDLLHRAKGRNSKLWYKKDRENHFSRLAHHTHVEIFCKSYEYERFLVRTNRGDDDGNWKRPSNKGHVHRIPLKFSHFDLQPDGDSKEKSEHPEKQKEEQDEDQEAQNVVPQTANGDQLRKVKHLEEKKQHLREKKQFQRLEKRAKTEAIRYRARVAADNFNNIFTHRVENKKELVVGANGETTDEKVAVVVRGISLDDI